jgi:hypothetical protein
MAGLAASSPVPLLLATELRSMTAVATVPGFDSAKTPILLEAIIVRRDFAEHARDGRRSSW